MPTPVHTQAPSWIAAAFGLAMTGLGDGVVVSWCGLACSGGVAAQGVWHRGDNGGGADQGKAHGKVHKPLPSPRHGEAVRPWPSRGCAFSVNPCTLKHPPGLPRCARHDGGE